MPNLSVNKFDICPHFARVGGGEGLEKVELSERRFMEGCAVQYRAHGEGGREEQRVSLLDIAPHLPIYQAKERDFQHLLLLLLLPHPA